MVSYNYMNYKGNRVEIEWKWTSRVEISWNWNGTSLRVEVDFHGGSTVEGSGPYKPPYMFAEFVIHPQFRIFYLEVIDKGQHHTTVRNWGI